VSSVGHQLRKWFHLLCAVVANVSPLLGVFTDHMFHCTVITVVTVIAALVYNLFYLTIYSSTVCRYHLMNIFSQVKGGLPLVMMCHIFINCIWDWRTH